MTEHTDKHYEQELKALKDSILKMGSVVEEMAQKAMKALVERDVKLARDIIGRDPQANQLEMEIDDRCVKLLALHQPVGSDLRFVTMGLRISKDLERMGDLAVNISQQAKELAIDLGVKPSSELLSMSEKACRMVKDTLDSFVSQDAEKAKKVCEMDDEVDDLNDKVFSHLLSMMEKNPSAVGGSVRLILVARHLERIADHATNIAEEVIFLVQGKDIRHGQGE